MYFYFVTADGFPPPFAARCAAGAFDPCPGAWAAGHFCPFRSASVTTIPCFCAKHPCHILPKIDEMNSHRHRTIHTVSGCFPCRSFSCRPALPAGLRPSVLPRPGAKKRRMPVHPPLSASLIQFYSSNRVLSVHFHRNPHQNVPRIFRLIRAGGKEHGPLHLIYLHRGIGRK